MPTPPKADETDAATASDVSKIPAEDTPPKKPSAATDPVPSTDQVPESGGRGGLDPTRYGDWETNGRCVDF